MASTEVRLPSFRRHDSWLLSRTYADRYLQLLRDTKDRGYMGQQFNYTPGVDGPSGGPEIKTNYPTPQQALGGRGTDHRKGNTSGDGGNTLY